MKKIYIMPQTELIAVAERSNLMENSGEVSGDDAMGKKNNTFVESDDSEENELLPGAHRRRLWDD